MRKFAIATTFAAVSLCLCGLVGSADAQNSRCYPSAVEFTVVTGKAMPAGVTIGKNSLDYANFSIFRFSIVSAKETWRVGQKLMETKYTAVIPDADFAELSKLCATQNKVLDCSVFSAWNYSPASSGRPVTLSFSDTPTGRSGLSVSIAKWTGGPPPLAAPGAFEPVRMIPPDFNPVEYKSYPFSIPFKVIENCSGK